MFNNTKIIDIDNKFISVDEDENIIKQETINSVEHQVQDQYLVLSKNDFGKTPQRINVGFFNKKTNFRISGKDSIIAYDKSNTEICSPSMEDIRKKPYNYFLIYKYPFMEDIWNKEIVLELKEIPETTFNIEFTNEFGEYIGRLLQILTELSKLNEIKDLSILTKESETFKEPIDLTKSLLLEKIIQVQGINKFSLNKKILLNSNPSFLMGILEGFFNTNENKFYKVPKTINIYNFSIILNLLSASYSIRSNKEMNSNENSFIIRFKLPQILNTSEKFKNSLSPELFRKHKYYFLPAKIGDNKDFKIKFLKDGITLDSEIIEDYRKNGFTEMMSQINNGYIELIPTWDLVFEKINVDKNSKEGIMYDLIMENDKAHNFNLNNLPMLHNSDGDIMGVIGLFTKEAAADARKHFSAENKLTFKNNVDTTIMNFGVKTDGQVGWYNATREN
jgi:hypothetical protein